MGFLKLKKKWFKDEYGGRPWEEPRFGKIFPNFVDKQWAAEIKELGPSKAKKY